MNITNKKEIDYCPFSILFKNSENINTGSSPVLANTLKAQKIFFVKSKLVSVSFFIVPGYNE